MILVEITTHFKYLKIHVIDHVLNIPHISVFSSVPSSQSRLPLHLSRLGMQSPSLHLNCPSLHTITGSPPEENQGKF